MHAAVTLNNVLVFRKAGILPRDLKFYYSDQVIEIVSKFTYLGIVFSVGCSFTAAHT
jgi:hypothetical protein